MVMSLILGFVSWGLSGDAIYHRNLKLLGVSWVCCAIPLLFQVLVLGNGNLSLLAVVRSRQK